MVVFFGWRFRFRFVVFLLDDGLFWRYWYLVLVVVRWGLFWVVLYVEWDELDLFYFLCEGFNGFCLWNNNFGIVMFIYRLRYVEFVGEVIIFIMYCVFFGDVL